MDTAAPAPAAAPAVPRSRATLALLAWTAFVWGTRLRNLVGDDGLTTGERWRSALLVGSFLGLGAVVAVGWWRRTSWARPALLVLAGWTTGVWVVRVVAIATADHDLPFVVVHAVLGIVSVGLAAVASRYHGPADHRHREAVEQPRRAAVRDQPPPVGDGA